MRFTTFALPLTFALIISVGCSDGEDDVDDDGVGLFGGSDGSGATGGMGTGSGAGPGSGGMGTGGMGTGGMGTGGMGTGGSGGSAASPVVINEVDADGDPEDWVELKNTSNVAVDISDWYFTDDDPTHIYTFPASTVIQPGDYLVVEGDVFSFGLGKSGDQVNLYDPSDVSMDATEWTVEMANPETWARIPDGTGDFEVLANGGGNTKGASND
jgi:hypothetical protein